MTIFAPRKQNHTLFEKHRLLIESSIDAVHKRVYFAAFPEMPSAEVYGENAETEQKKKFESQLGNKFDRLKQSSDAWLSACEQSPYTLQPLAISYPTFSKTEDF